MKLIGLLITILLISLIFVWWIGKSVDRTNNAMQTIQQVEGNGEQPVQSNTNPVDYSKQKVEDYNQLQEDRANELNQLP